MIRAILTILIVVGFFTIFISFLMSPDSNGFSGALVGSNDLELFRQSKERGVKKFLKYSMTILGALIMIISVFLRFLVFN
ncbi:preprotein translocase subunit SecG [Mycoplasmopsis gallopavonis]|uniref:Protein-export membrane protein SecG n=1 Tax=Mycoplasmopsis gallopavonis TaxID=76629 RepID=A0A449AYT8_9BACT|nr:preprotein translocase subunit SecG [Mycoplasmopsis gallopavonis]RIV16637.1 preprotein translocase subunit SecG [Mycoplasmopsis gallopavonis]VEU72693.1 preprotein translocase, SecG subunit [Mycoplasmopsis gallopavonis]